LPAVCAGEGTRWGWVHDERAALALTFAPTAGGSSERTSGNIMIMVTFAMQTAGTAICGP
jgi:hypothetical protein